MIPQSNPFREYGNVETFVSKWLAEEDKKPLIKWFDKFEKALKKLGVNYAKSKIDPTDAMDMYYDGKKPEEAAKALAEDVQLDESVNVVVKFKSDTDGAAAVGSETSRTGLLDGGKKVKDGEYSLTFKNDRMKDKFMKKYDSKLAESVELDEMQPHGMFGGQDDLGPVYRMIRSALDKIGIGYRISGQTVKVNPKNVGAAKAALKKAKGFDKSGMSVVKDNKVAFAEESVELTDEEQKLLDFINKNW